MMADLSDEVVPDGDRWVRMSATSTDDSSSRRRCCAAGHDSPAEAWHCGEPAVESADYLRGKADGRRERADEVAELTGKLAGLRSAASQMIETMRAHDVPEHIIRDTCELFGFQYVARL